MKATAVLYTTPSSDKKSSVFANKQTTSNKMMLILKREIFCPLFKFSKMEKIHKSANPKNKYEYIVCKNKTKSPAIREAYMIVNKC